MISRFGSIPALVLALLWIGVLLGVSFLATPIKFAAPSLELPVALDVGRHTFALFNRIELGLAVALLAAVIAGVRRRNAIVALVLILVLLALESVWLLPALDARAEMIMQGQVPPPSALHTFYVGAEAIKLLCLAVIAWAGGQRSALFPASTIKESR